MPYSTGAWGEQAKDRSEYRKQYFRNYKIKLVAELIARSIEIPKGQICELCHRELATLKHHPDYSNRSSFNLHVEDAIKNLNRGE